MSLATIATATALLLLTPAVHALDPDCTLPNGKPYNGYALKTGTGCRQYVNCQNGIINGWLTCPNNLLYSGKVAESGICTWPSMVKCDVDDDAGGGGGGDDGRADAVASLPPPRVDEDCALPPDTPDTAPLYTGYALKIGTQCKQYIYCTSGLITSWHTCPNNLLYSGKVAEPGICTFPSDVQCADEAAGGGGADGAASLPPPRVDEDCALPPDTPDTAPLYTGYALKVGTQCKQYVYCTSGLISSWHTCPNNLLYSGKVAEAGICNHPEAVKCVDPVSSTAPDEAALEVVEEEEEEEEDDPPPGINMPSSNQLPSSGFCGVDQADAKSSCRQPCQNNSDCCSPSESCFTTGPSCINVDYSGSSHYFCGSSWCDAADTCGRPCPSGNDAECPFGLECFADVPCGHDDDYGREETLLDAFMKARNEDDANNNSEISGNFIGGSNMSDKLLSFLTDNDVIVNAAGANDNPDNYFCGSSPEDAASRCVPCASGKMEDCGASFMQGCFKGINVCARSGGENSSSNGSGTVSLNDIMANNFNSNLDEMVEEYLDNNQNQIQNQNLPTYETNEANNAYEQVQNQPNSQPTQPMTDASEPAPAPASVSEPTLPPWTNAPFNPSPTNTDKTVIGYYASWQWYDRDKFADPQNIDFTKYDRINFAFFQPCPQGNLYGTDEWGDPQLLWGPYVVDPAQQRMSGPNRNYFCSWDGPLQSDRNCAYHDTSKGLINLVHAVGVEIMPSIGGWTLSDNFPTVAASATKRNNFAQQCVELIQAYGFDGIDIDWEYPGYEDHSGTPEDTVNFTLLLRAVRYKLDALGNNRFGRPYGLTAALPCGPDKIEKIQVNQIKDILTELNLMSYDMHGAWDELTGTNAPMFDQGWTDKTPRWSVHGCVNNYVDRGVPLSKMNIGLPFYGRSFQGATGMKQFHGGADDINYHLDEGSPQYFNIVNELSRMTTYRHENTQTQYATFNTGGLVSYDDPRAICDKVAYANERGMHGFLIWEISGDMIDMGNGNMATPLADAMNAKIRNPNYDCSSLSDPSWALSDQTYREAPDEPDSVDWSNYVIPMSSGSANDFNGAQTQSSRNQESSNASSQSGDDCPIDYTGTYASAGCTGYVYCQDGEVVGDVKPCVPGTLFDVTIGVCQWANQVIECGA